MRVEEMLLEVDVNKQDVNKAVLVLRREDGMFLLRADDLPEFRLQTPSREPFLKEGDRFFPLNTIPGARFEFDEERQRLSIVAGVDAFASSLETVPTAKELPLPIKSSPGGFLNYSMSVSHAGTGTSASGVLELGAFSRHGVVVSNVLVSDKEDASLVRLDTTYTLDLPDRRSSLRVGDSINRAGSWGRSVRFGGLQFGTNFATQPSFLPFPLQAVAGQATVPSIVDVFVNNALVATREVRPGPFSINNIPVTTGSGNLRLVVRDLLNREQAVTVTQPFYGTNTLLRQGLSDYSLEGGWIRNDFGIRSFEYSNPFATATYRYGLTDNISAEARTEVERDRQLLGLSTTLLQPRIGVIDAGVISSRSGRGSGAMYMLGYQLNGTRLTAGGQSLWTTPGFEQIGYVAPQRPPRNQYGANVGLQLGAFGSFTVNYAVQRFREVVEAANEASAVANLRIASLGYSVGLGRWAQLSLSALRSFGERPSTSFSASVTIPLEASTTASIGFDKLRSQETPGQDVSLMVQRNRPPGEGFGYRIATRDRDVQAAASYQNNLGAIEAEATRFQGTLATRLSLQGGVGYVAGIPFLSRAITGSFGVVQVADYPDVGVLLDNQLAGRTNSRGFAVLPQLRPYDRNVISIDQNELPLDAQVQNLKMEAAPYFRSGVLVDFPVKHQRAAIMNVFLDDGMPLPSGAVARIEGETEEFPVALDGEVYLSGFGTTDRVTLSWKGQACTIEVTFPATTEPLPNLGRFVCKGVKP